MREFIARLPYKGRRSGPRVDPAKYAIPLLVLFGSLLAGLIASGVLPLKTSTDSGKVLYPYFLGPEGVVITGRDAVKLRSSGGEVVIDISAGSVSSPALIRYQRIIPSGIPSLPQGYLSTGRFFVLSAEPETADGSPVNFQQMLSITVVIEPGDLELAGNDYSRFALQHFLEQQRYWEILETTANPLTSTVVAQVDGLSLFALTVGPDSDSNTLLPTLRTETAPEATETPMPSSTTVPTPATPPSPTPAVGAIPETTPAATPTSTPIPVPTATAVPTPTPVPAPTASLEPTASPMPTTVKLHGFRLYVNGVALLGGQTTMAIPNGEVRVNRPPDDDDTYPPGSVIRVSVVPAVSGSGVIMAGFRSQGGLNRDIYMNLDNYVTVFITLPTPTHCCPTAIADIETNHQMHPAPFPRAARSNPTT